jgi:hypothetical protein
MPLFRALCPFCNEKVDVSTRLERADLTAALAQDADVRVMHTTDRDHEWSLRPQDKANLRQQIANGLV